MKEIGSRERYMLSRYANNIKPLLRIGKNGVTVTFLAALDELLEKRELVKIKFVDFKDEKQEIAADIASRTGSVLVRIIGNIAIYYRQAMDPRKRKIMQENNSVQG